MEKVGLLFGSFNPVHNGHIEIAKFFLNKSEIDKIIFVVTPNNPFKSKDKSMNFSKRLKTVILACNSIKNSKIKASDIEFSIKEPNYTYKTLRLFRENNPGTEFVLLMGEDLLLNFDQWKKYQEILTNHFIYIYPRNHSKEIIPEIIKHRKIIFFDAPKMKVSSSLVRENILNGKSINNLVPKEVFDFIIKDRLYKC
ncbi:MAG: nicotinate (nicotinamide) nucleotide adenylyltransferase [Flavobacteriaceae bacterium]|nr:nicotinate (nicotinamide) nucleotide adenylyltransferase [Flavobacteriaceae bacterium]|tara:strand:- start:19995 stop:20585 length:591 start_codon:yes stop_codon:yes gene_type:complete